jgi:hypothetical protein
MFANGCVDIAWRVSRGQSPRERVKIVHFGFTAPREIGLSPKTGGQVTRDDGDEDEERLVSLLEAVIDAPVVRLVMVKSSLPTQPTPALP